jgi:tRNA isopentenyl-2-thiomethyl-A-37 hydroxylase MiaE
MERFEQFVRVSDEELRKYYDDVYAPEARARGERVAPLEEVSDAIRQNRALEKTNEEVGSWLIELRRRSVIEKIPN